MCFNARLLVAAIIALGSLTVQTRAADWNRGVAMYNTEDYPAALAEFQDLVIESPGAAGAWYYIGLCEFKLKHFKRVELPLSRAIELMNVESPAGKDIEGAWYTLGFARYALSDYEKAAAALKRYAELAGKSGRPVDSNARRALARSYFFLDRYDDALAILNSPAAAKDTPTDGASDAYYTGAIYFKREDDRRAISALRQALIADPKDAASLELLAESLMRQAGRSHSKPDWNEAADAAERLQTLRNDQRTDSICGRAFLGAQRFQKAVGPLERLAKASPEDGKTWLYYGIALSRSGLLRRAMEALEITIRITPDSLPALAELAYVYESDKQYQQALRVYEKAYNVSGQSDPSFKQSADRVRALAAQ